MHNMVQHLLYLGSFHIRLYMQYIENIKLKTKLLLLFILITLGLLSIAILGYLNINSMKKNIDSLYFGSLIPVTELNDIVQIYNGNIYFTIHNRSNEMNPLEISVQIKEQTSHIDKLWKSYTSHFKRYAERDYVEYATKEVIATNGYLLKIALLVENEKVVTLELKDAVEKKVLYINAIVKKLIRYEVDMARYDRKVFLSNYDDVLMQLSIILSVIIIAVLLTSRYVFTSIAEEHCKLNAMTEKLKNASYTDVLTSLKNRRFFNEIYEREVKRALRAKSYFTFMMLDIDYFKQYNDTYGHLEGDEALKKVAQVLQKILKRPTDFVFRLGGEEFGVILTQTDEVNSAKLADMICNTLKEQKIEHKNSQACEYLTLSIGVVCCKMEEIEDTNIILSKADEMLYKAKESGRNTYVMTNSVQEVSENI